MGRSIGELGTRREPVDLEFGYFGSVIRVHPAATDTVELEFLDIGRDIDLDALRDKSLDELDDEAKMATVVAMGKAVRSGYMLVKDSLRQVVHPDDWELYWSTARANGQQIVDLMTDLKRITTAVVEASTGFPTGPPSASADGRGSMPQRSAADSSSVAGRRDSDADKALQMLANRPDLQEFIVMEEESKAAKAQKAGNAPGTAASRMLAATGR